MPSAVPQEIPNWINNEAVPAASGDWFDKLKPTDGQLLCRVARSGAADVRKAIEAAGAARGAWADTTVVARGDLMRAIALRMMERKAEIAEIVALETGKSRAEALGETQAAIEMGFFVAGEGRRYYGKTTTATMAHRTVMTQRMPLGIAGLIIASNTPIANVAWKAFPAMLCGNPSIMKPSEETPATAWIFGEICKEAGLPPGVFNLVQGLGAEAGAPLVESPAVAIVSFTGSCRTGTVIQTEAGRRLAKVCMELGGKNALVVCDDADLDNAERWVLASSFSNAGQRCAAASRIIVFDAIYDAFRDRLVNATRALKLGPEDDAFLGPVINEGHLNTMLAAVQQAREQGARLLVGGERLRDPEHAAGYYMAPTILDHVAPGDAIAQRELFGPITILFRVKNFDEALALANNSTYGLTSSIHTNSLHRAMQYADKVEAGVVVVNGGTHGSEPHMGFGGVKDSGTGWREAGLEALDVYSDWKYVNLIHDPGKV
jgi:aldehyde dehydrogenase (NAD+)